VFLTYFAYVSGRVFASPIVFLCRFLRLKLCVCMRFFSLSLTLLACLGGYLLVPVPVFVSLYIWIYVSVYVVVSLTLFAWVSGWVFASPSVCLCRFLCLNLYIFMCFCLSHSFCLCFWANVCLSSGCLCRFVKSDSINLHVFSSLSLSLPVCFGGFLIVPIPVFFGL
jgi:hypothetical protein